MVEQTKPCIILHVICQRIAPRRAYNSKRRRGLEYSGFIGHMVCNSLLIFILDVVQYNFEVSDDVK
jgi:hypothetical protein